jgi:hypothetical protein
MDFLLAALPEIAGEVFGSVAHLLNLDLDVVFVDTTSTYFETESPDELPDLAEDVVDNQVSNPVESGHRTFGHSKDHRPDLPQVVIAMAVTRDGIPVRCWTFPGNQADTTIIRTIKDDLDGWHLRRLVWVADRGFASATNRTYLTRGGGHYIHAEKLRHTNSQAAAALARAGRYHPVTGNLRVKEVHVNPRDPATSGIVDDGGPGMRAVRFVVCHNPEAADRDAAVRDNLISYLQQLIAGSDEWTPTRRDELVGSLKTKPGVRRYLRRTRTGRLRIDQAAITRESHLDGKWLLRTSDPTLTPEDLAAAYKQLLAVENGWRDMKSALKLRPVFHYREDRIRAHIQLCWLALCSSGSPRPPLATPGAPSPTNWTACIWSPWFPGHQPRPGQPTHHHHRRAAQDPDRAQTARTGPVPRLRPHHRLTQRAGITHSCSNTTRTRHTRIRPGQTWFPRNRVAIP